MERIDINLITYNNAADTLRYYLETTLDSIKQDLRDACSQDTLDISLIAHLSGDYLELENTLYQVKQAIKKHEDSKTNK